METTIKTIAAMGDVHMKLSERGLWKPVFEEIAQQAQVLLLCGDLTDTGDDEEARLLAEELRNIGIPVIAVLGNHDHEKGRQKIIREIMLEHQIHILDGEAVVIGKVGFAGVKGFGGGFDRHMSAMFGEAALKAFVQEAVNESLALDRALSKLEQEHPEHTKIALMHYAPIKDTVEGESPEIFPFLGSTHLVEPLQRRKVSAAFHGHAHAGKLQGETYGGIPIFNVAIPVLRAHQDKPYYLLKT